MKKIIYTIIAILFTGYIANAQTDSTSTPLEISGSIDTYFKYDFAKTSNIPTSFVNEQNSISLGMIDVALKKTTGKASFVGELSFGPRSESSIPVGNFHIQNLYASYAFTDQFSMTAGYMGTFVGYEVISPVPNFNYSTSYLFANGPFQNAGIKANYRFSDRFSVMAGLFNDWNVYQDLNGFSSFGAQVFVSPVEGWSAYLNVLTGTSASGKGTYGSGTVLDLTTTYQLTKKVMVGLNAADYDQGTSTPDGTEYSGLAIYPQYSFTDNFALGLRGEYFKYKDVGAVEGESITAFTLTANLKAGGLRFIPELRLDNSKTNTFGFVKSDGTATKTASQLSLALVYAF
ncbi:porin [Pelobium manganitolerans]|uniref:porin n=1 Tax=Pelobium manganitolerans TaxID=1842495 RepID=UPI003FA39D8A